MDTSQGIVKDWSIPGAQGQPIFGTTHIPSAEPRGIILICHGFKGYKDYGFFPHLAASACRQRLIAHRFNFSHCGVTQDYQTFARTDLFESDTWGKQIHDLQVVAAAAATGQLPDAHVDTLPMIWFGHSRGGITVLLTASMVCSGSGHSGVPKPAGVVAAATPKTSCSLEPEHVQRLRRRGYLETPSSRTGQVLRLGKAWLEEIEDDPVTFDPMVAISQISCPILLVHGDDDKTVSVTDAHRLKAAAGQRARLEVIGGASHTFNAPNPLSLDQTPPPLTDRMIQLVCAFAADPG